jgi:hypothetical protein
MTTSAREDQAMTDREPERWNGDTLERCARALWDSFQASEMVTEKYKGISWDTVLAVPNDLSLMIRRTATAEVHAILNCLPPPPALSGDVEEMIATLRKRAKWEQESSDWDEPFARVLDKAASMLEARSAETEQFRSALAKTIGKLKVAHDKIEAQAMSADYSRECGAIARAQIEAQAREIANADILNDLAYAHGMRAAETILCQHLADSDEARTAMAKVRELASNRSGPAVAELRAARRALHEDSTARAPGGGAR